MREKILFDKGWMFHQGELDIPFPIEKAAAYRSAKTERMLWGPAAVDFFDGTDPKRPKLRTTWFKDVDLPHDYIITQEPSTDYNATLGFFKYENAWYRKHFNIPAEDEGKRLTLLFDGVATHATVYLNGCLMKHNFCGYTSFEVDITDVARYGEDNVLAVYVECDSHEGWWYEGAGIYRHVWLVKTEPVSVDLWGVFVKPQKKSDSGWKIDFQTTVRNDTYSEKEITIQTNVLDKDGNIICTAKCGGTAEYRDKATLCSEAEVESPHLWDIDDPYLYTAETIVYVGDTEVDRVYDRFGFRYYHVDPEKGFFLNGRHVKIKGVCAHNDCGLLGKAVPDNIYRYKVKMLKEMGANGYRTSHYPHPEATMDALDEMGFIVMDETRWLESTVEGKEQLEMLIKRDRNRPSVFFWSIGNEEFITMTPQGKRIAASLAAFTHKMDDSRMVTYAEHRPLFSQIYDSMDVIGINYNLEAYETVHEQNPDKAILAAECCATSSTRGWYEDTSEVHGYMSAYDSSGPYFKARELTWKMLCKHDWILGGYQWDSFEHRGESLWPRLCSQAGAIDLFLQRKDAFYQNQSHWSADPMVHLLPHWNLSGREGETIAVWAYTNCDSVELFLNGKSLGKVEVEKYGHAEWQVEYVPGTIEAIAYIDGKEVCRDSHTTTKQPCALKLIHDTDNIEANGRDVALFTCVCVDEDGREVPDAAVTVDFSTNALGVIVGTGSDVCDHTPVPSLTRRMRAGKISVAVKVGETAGELKLRASSSMLKGTSLSVMLK